MPWDGYATVITRIRGTCTAPARMYSFAPQSLVAVRIRTREDLRPGLQLER